MRIYAIGDLHLSFDERIEKPMDIFGPRWVNHHERVKEKWESLVGPEDVVIIPGDVSWGLRQEEAIADLDWIHNLPGQKSNHQRQSRPMVDFCHEAESVIR